MANQNRVKMFVMKLVMTMKLSHFVVSLGQDGVISLESQLINAEFKTICLNQLLVKLADLYK